MNRHLQRYACILIACAAASSLALASDDKASAERTILGYYHEMEQGYAAKDTSRIFRHYDPSHVFTSWNKPGATDVNTNRRNLDQTFGTIKTIQMKVIPEATDMAGDKFYIRYKQDHQILFPLKSSPANLWYEAEDTWQHKNGGWVLVSTKVVNDAVSQAQGMLEQQKKRMEFEDEQRRSQRCLNGLGYGCGGSR